MVCIAHASHSVLLCVTALPAEHAWSLLDWLHRTHNSSFVGFKSVSSVLHRWSGLMCTTPPLGVVLLLSPLTTVEMAFCVICILSLLCFPISDHSQPWRSGVWDVQLQARVGLYETTNATAYDYQLLHPQHAQCGPLLAVSGFWLML